MTLADWLAAHGFTQVAMEDTGVYWKCVYYVREEQFELWLVNAQHVKNARAARRTPATPRGYAGCLSTSDAHATRGGPNRVAHQAYFLSSRQY